MILLFGIESAKKLFTVTHTKAREYPLPDKLRQDMDGQIFKLEVFEGGKYIYAANNDLICIYKSDKNQTIFRYKKQGEARPLYFSIPYCLPGKEIIVVPTYKFAIGIDLAREKEIFRLDSEGFFSTLVGQEPITFKDRKVLLGD